jgi:hypothetical protein
MSSAEIKPTGKAEVKPTAKVEVKPDGKTEAKPAAKAETRQAGKGSKRRPYRAKLFAANYGAIRWGKRQSKRPKVKP